MATTLLCLIAIVTALLTVGGRRAVFAANPNAVPAQRVLFTVYDVGILPRVMHVKKGMVAVLIEDLSGGTTGVEIERKTGGPSAVVGDVHRDAARWRGRSDMRLDPGQYEVYSKEHPQNRSLLIVDP